MRTLESAALMRLAREIREDERHQVTELCAKMADALACELRTRAGKPWDTSWVISRREGACEGLATLAEMLRASR